MDTLQRKSKNSSIQWHTLASTVNLPKSLTSESDLKLYLYSNKGLNFMNLVLPGLNVQQKHKNQNVHILDLERSIFTCLFTVTYRLVFKCSTTRVKQEEAFILTLIKSVILCYLPERARSSILSITRYLRLIKKSLIISLSPR